MNRLMLLMFDSLSVLSHPHQSTTAGSPTTLAVFQGCWRYSHQEKPSIVEVELAAHPVDFATVAKEQR